MKPCSTPRRPSLSRTLHLLAALAAVLALAGPLGGLPARPRPAAAATPERLDRHLRALRDNRPSPAPLTLHTLAGAPAVDVLVQSSRDVARELAQTGAAVRSSVGRGPARVHTARVP